MHFLTRSILYLVIFLASVLFYSCDELKKTPNYEIVLEADMHDVLSKFAGENSRKDYFINALKKTDEKTKSSTNYLDLFIPILRGENPAPLAYIFSIKTADSTNKGIIRYIQEQINTGMERQLSVIKERLRVKKIEVPFIQRSGATSIVMKIYAEDTSNIKDWLCKNAELYFFEALSYTDVNKLIVKMESEIQRNDTLRNLFTDTARAEAMEQLLIDLEETDSAKNASSEPIPSALIRSLKTENSPFISCEIKDTALINSIILHPILRRSLSKEINFYWIDDNYPEFLPVYNQTSHSYHWMDGRLIANSSVDSDKEGNIMINFEMNEEGTIQWKDLTSRLSKTHYGRIAIVMDNKCYMAPTVETSIPNGRAVITGKFSLEEAMNASVLINSGSLPFACRVVKIKAI